MLKYRPHHFLCTLGFQGKGYSDEFIKNFQAIADQLRESPQGDDEVIEVVADTDSICAPCPNRMEKLCTSEAKIRTLDQAHAKSLGIQPGEKLTWGQAKERIASKIDEKTFDRICEPCSWKSMGVCLSALKALKEGNQG